MANPSPAPDRMAAAIDMWKRKLLDLTRRNRALNFKVNKVSTVTIVDEQPAEVFRTLVLEGESMRFRPMLAARTPGTGVPPADDEEGEAGLALEEEEPDTPSYDFTPYEASALANHHTDDLLQAEATPEQLDKSLRRLEEQARLSLEEQGVNTLFLTLGMLHYKEAEDAETAFRAPLLLVPVTLERQSARSGYRIKATDDEPVVNPALNEYLRRFHGGLELPVLPDSEHIAEDYNFQGFLRDLTGRIADRAGWQVKRDIYLAPFTFQKLVMYKDLDSQASLLASHELIRKLVLRDGTFEVTLPKEVRDMDLDEHYPPESTAQVVDADSSQLRAIATVAKGHNLVLEGPPGTGKSQTITNLIARALHDGKSVLFVAEKMAALEVVAKRLGEAGLGQFCLELHSTKANKRLVMQQVATALEASLQRAEVPRSAATRLPALRRSLTAYVMALHEPYGALARTPYWVYGELQRVIDAPRISWSGSATEVTQDQLTAGLRTLGELSAVAGPVGNPAEHPWRDSTRTLYTEANLDALQGLLAQLADKLDRLIASARTVEDELALPPIRLLSDVVVASAIADVMGRSPGAPLGVVSNDAWNAPPAQATGLIAEGQALRKLREHVAQRFLDTVLDQDHSGDIAYIEQKNQGFLSFFAFLDGRYRSIKRRWLAYRKPTQTGSLMDQVAEMRQVDRLLAGRAALAAKDATGRELFGGLWHGERSDWSVLEGYIRWVVEFRTMCVRHGLAGRAVETAAQRQPSVAPVTELCKVASEVESLLTELRGLGGWPSDYLASTPLAEIRTRVAALTAGLYLAPRWAAFELMRARAAQGITRSALEAGMAGQVAFGDLGRALLRAFYQQWLEAAVTAREPLRDFATMSHRQRVEEFQELDELVLAENRTGLVAGLRAMVQERLRTPEAMAGMPALRREMTRQRGLSPVRVTLKRAGAAVRAIKPCFMMSPLSVAQMLDASMPSFDLVVFDEASQLPAEDAVGAIMRGRQLVVVGDPKQLPPTNFFAVQGGQVSAPLDEDGVPVVEDSESILEEFMAAGVPQCRLKWHYRSAHESLITFSNVSFYDADLYTFPSVERGNDGLGLSFEYIPDGVYEGKGLNLVEARRVANAVVWFAKEQEERINRGEHPLTLGVGTFNLRQQLAIQDELEVRRRQDPSLEPFFSRRDEGGFFVKNLENIQGDERDVIFLSVTYAKDREGRLRYNFGPLNGANGWRRLNVLTTRARRLMRVFSSMKGDEINPATGSSQGPRLLREFLLYAERGTLESVTATQGAATESPFEREVYLELTRRGLSLQPQVGVAGYRIDLGVLDDVVPGRYLCGIECDGVAYHASETARDRDRLRQQVLEARGWTIIRIWSTDWFKDRSGTIERVLAEVERSRQEASAEAEEARKSAARTAATRAEEEQAAAERAARHAAEGPPPAVQPPPEGYERREGPAYCVTPGEGQFAGHSFLEAPTSGIADQIHAVVRTESPVHVTDVAARVAGMWSTRLGSRIQAHFDDACRRTVRAGRVEQRGEFLYLPGGSVVARSRAGTRIPSDRIAPEEYRAAVLAVLEGGHSFAPEALIAEVRSYFGYGRSGSALEERVQAAVDRLLSDEEIGEGPFGLRRRD